MVTEALVYGPLLDLIFSVWEDDLHTSPETRWWAQCTTCYATHPFSTEPRLDDLVAFAHVASCKAPGALEAAGAIALRMGVTAGDAECIAHFWYADRGVDVRLCDADTDPLAASPDRGCASRENCRRCVDLYADDLVAGHGRFRIVFESEAGR